MLGDEFNPFRQLDKSRLPKDTDEKQRLRRQAAAKKPSPPPPVPATDDEQGLFQDAMRGVNPLPGQHSGAATNKKPTPTPATAQDDALARAQLLDIVQGKVEFALTHTDEYQQGHVCGLSPKIIARFRTGWYNPEAHLDLHGQNVEQACSQLMHFIKDSYLRDLRCVLVIPGRGRNSPEGQGILRERVQAWLTRDPLKRVVLAFCTALPRHGGAGALYVLLRKRRGEGRILWERGPFDVDDDLA